jgi:hypothetical protein
VESCFFSCPVGYWFCFSLFALLLIGVDFFLPM